MSPTAKSKELADLKTRVERLEADPVECAELGECAGLVDAAVECGERELFPASVSESAAGAIPAYEFQTAEWLRDGTFGPRVAELHEQALTTGYEALAELLRCGAVVDRIGGVARRFAGTVAQGSAEFSGAAMGNFRRACVRQLEAMTPRHKLRSAASNLSATYDLVDRLGQVRLLIDAAADAAAADEAAELAARNDALAERLIPVREIRLEALEGRRYSGVEAGAFLRRGAWDGREDIARELETAARNFEARRDRPRHVSARRGSARDRAAAF